MNFTDFMNGYEAILHAVAEVTVHTLELIGISIIIIGSIKALAKVFSRIRKRQPVNVIIDLGRSLALALEFKMGAEIVNTVIVRDLRELGILAIVIALRAVLALLIHWEIKNEQKEAALENECDNKNKGSKSSESDEK